MASTYSTNLAIELIGTGDQAGSWGNTTNTNLGTLIEQAISGYVTQAVSTGTDTTITIPNGATGVARNMYIELTGTGGTNTNLIVPANKKLYFIFNNSTGAVTVKVSGQTGVSVPTGKKMVLVSNGTDIVNGLNYIADFGTNSFTVTNLSATSATITNLIATSASITTLTNNPTFGAGTANGVLYLNGSKVATSGSALSFTGALLKVGNPTNAPNTNLSGNLLQVKSSSGFSYLTMGNGDGADNNTYIGSASSITTFGTVTDAGTTSELMRLTSSVLSTGSSINVGIGTTSPAQKLDVTGGARFYSAGNWMQFGVNALESLNNDGGYIRAVISTASNPTYSWQGDQNTGIFTPAADTIGVTTGGTERMRLTSSVLSTDSSINVGIGTASPASKLHVSNTAAATRITITDDVGAGRSGYIESNYSDALVIGTTSGVRGIRFSPDNTPRMLLDTLGNLGIGTASPAYQLTVLRRTGSTITAPLLNLQSQTSGSVDGDSFILYGTQTANWAAGVDQADSNKFRIEPSTTLGAADGLTITTAGNLGIGTTSPEALLHLNKATAGGAGPYLMLDNSSSSTLNSSAGISFSLDAGSSFAGYSARIEGINTNAGNGASDITFSTWNGSARGERARITSGGDFLTAGKTTASFTTVGAELLANGQINTASANLDNLNIYNTTAAAYRFYVSSGGTVFATNTTISAISDQRLKENVRDLDVGLDAIMALKPRKFDWKEGKGQDKKDVRGFIAQEFEQVFPDLIDEWKDPAPEGEEPYKSVRQDLIPVLVKAIQELSAKVAALEAK
jgi:hypothetical protein